MRIGVEGERVALREHLPEASELSSVAAVGEARSGALVRLEPLPEPPPGPTHAVAATPIDPRAIAALAPIVTRVRALEERAPPGLDVVIRESARAIAAMVEAATSLDTLASEAAQAASRRPVRA